jgi:multisubunit Na+/H+ antiporter MnhB subunit
VMQHKSARQHAKAPVYRVTGVRKGLTEDVRGRQRRYVITMVIRTVCFVVAVILFQVTPQGPGIAIALGLIFASLIIPYFAVIIANAGREPNQLPPTARLFTSRPALEPGPSAGNTQTQGSRTGDSAEHVADF